MLKNNRLLPLVLSILFFSQVVSQNSTTSIPEPATLDEAIEKVKKKIQNGATRQEIAEYVTQMVYNRLTFLNHHWYLNQRDGRLMPDDEIEKKEKLFGDWRYKSKMVEEEYCAATWSWKNRMGQCNESANTALHILIMAYESSDGITTLDMPDHRYVVMGDITNIPDVFSSKDLQALDNTYIIDPWADQSFPTKELGFFDFHQNKDGRKQSAPMYKKYMIDYEKWLKWCKDNPVKYKDWLNGTSKYWPLVTSIINNIKCPENNPESGNTSEQLFPKNKQEGTYVKCRYHYPNKMGQSILASKVGYYKNKKVIAEYFDSRNFRSKHVQYSDKEKKRKVTTFYDTGKKSSESTYNFRGSRSSYKAWHKDGSLR